MKRWIHASDDSDIQNGFLFEQGDRAFFLVTDSKNLTEKVIRKFINAVCDLRNIGDKIREASLYDKATLNDFRRRIDKAQLERTPYGYKISGSSFTISYPEGDFEEEVTIFD